MASLIEVRKLMEEDETDECEREGHSSEVEHQVCMQEAPGSNLRGSEMENK